MKQIKTFVKLIRMKQWIKNGIIFLPIFFAKQVSVQIVAKSVIAFMAFSLLASSIYIFNDIVDVEKDRLHPVKCKRPIAAGAIGVLLAKVISIILLVIGYLLMVVGSGLDKQILLPTSVVFWTYYILNIFYSVKGKNIPLVDISILASGFLFRLFFGAFAVDITVSNWLYMVILFGAFYLGLGKRRNELKKISEEEREESRAVLKYYTYSFLDKNMYLCLALTIMFYALWCADYEGKSNLLIFTIPLVLLLAMKYGMIIESDDSEGDPTDIILNDKVFILLGFIFVVALVLILYVF